MFEVAAVSFVTCFALYLVLLRAIPTILRAISKDTINYFHNKIKPHEQQHHAQVVVSFLHAIVATVGAYQCIQSYDFTNLRQLGSLIVIEEPYYPELVALRHFYLEITLGYFFADLLIYCLDISAYPALDIGHHIVSIVAYVIGIYISAGSFIMIIFQTNEISTPFLHLRYFFLQWDMKEKLMYKLSEVTFVLLFIAARIVFNFYIMIGLWYGVLTITAKYHPSIVGFLFLCGNLYFAVQVSGLTIVSNIFLGVVVL